MARLINADAFLEEARNRIDMQDMYLPIHIKYFVIDEMPTIDAEPREIGHWLPYEFGDYHWHKCSVCGKADKYIETIGNGDLQAIRHFCPICGARMDEDEISNIAKESADKISKALEKVRAKGMQKQNIKEDGEP